MKETEVLNAYHNLFMYFNSKYICRSIDYFSTITLTEELIKKIDLNKFCHFAGITTEEVYHDIGSEFLAISRNGKALEEEELIDYIKSLSLEDYGDDLDLFIANVDNRGEHLVDSIAFYIKLIVEENCTGLIKNISPYVKVWLKNYGSLDVLIKRISSRFDQRWISNECLCKGIFVTQTPIFRREYVQFLNGNLLVNEVNTDLIIGDCQWVLGSECDSAETEYNLSLYDFSKNTTRYILLSTDGWDIILWKYKYSLVTLKTEDGQLIHGLVVFPTGRKQQSIRFLGGEKPTVNINLDWDKTLMTQEQLTKSEALFLPTTGKVDSLDYGSYLCRDSGRLYFDHHDVRIEKGDDYKGFIRLCKISN